MLKTKQPIIEPEELQPEDSLVTDLQAQVDVLAAQLALAQAKEQRALADYQNVLRRTQEERVKTIKLATKDLVSDLLQPLNHLSLAAQHLDDPGLNMVITQLWEALKQNGLEELNPVGQEFDLDSMEAIEVKTEGATTVSTVVAKGYRLNGTVIQVAKVILG